MGEIGWGGMEWNGEGWEGMGRNGDGWNGKGGMGRDVDGERWDREEEGGEGWDGWQLPSLPQLPSDFEETPPRPLKLNLNGNYPHYPNYCPFLERPHPHPGS